MTRFKNSLSATVAVLCVTLAMPALAAGDAPAKAPFSKATVEKTVTTTKSKAGKAVTSTTSWESREKVILPDGTKVFSFMEFDGNGDGVLSRKEIGDKLFKMYDTDGNQILDNNEYVRKAVITIHPIEKETVVTYDVDGDGIADKTQVTHEQFLRETKLARFDKNKNGLSAQEFAGRSFLQADINNDKAVDLKEFMASYNADIDKSLKMKAETNR